MDQQVGGLRGSSLSTPGNSFARQLGDEITESLKAAGLYDPGSNTVIEGELTDSFLDAAIGTGSARLAARITIDRDTQRVFDKEIAVQSQWESSFMGAVALPMAINQYGSLYKALVQRLAQDPAFRSAMSR